jgi:hypothetical protein
MMLELQDQRTQINTVTRASFPTGPTLTGHSSGTTYRELTELSIARKASLSRVRLFVVLNQRASPGVLTTEAGLAKTIVISCLMFLTRFVSFQDPTRYWRLWAAHCNQISEKASRHSAERVLVDELQSDP